MSIQDYRDLVVRQKAMAYTNEIPPLTKSFPREEQFGLTSQIRRLKERPTPNPCPKTP